MKQPSFFQRRATLWYWRTRHLWFDTNLGKGLCLGTAAALLVMAGVYMGWKITQPPPTEQQAVVWWVYVIWMVVAALVAMALAPKPKNAEAGTPEVPVVEDGQGVTMVFGEVWITDPTLGGHRPMGTKNIRGKKSGFSGRPIIGYWYKQLFYFLICRGPVDALLEFRGGDKPAWQGYLTNNANLTIAKKDLWGGDKTGAEGGIEGVLEVRFGYPEQGKSSYLLGNLGPNQSAHRGRLTAVYQGGIWGAYSPYPKNAAFKVRRIVAGWEGAGCWYPATAVVPVGGSEAGRSFDLDGKTAHFTPGEDEEGLITVKSGEFLVIAVVPGLYQGYSLWATDAEVPPDRKPWRCAVNVSINDSAPVTYYPGEYDTREEAFATTQLNPIVLNIPGSYRIYLSDGDGEAYNNRGGLSFMLTTARAFAMNPAHIIYQSITDSWMGDEPVAVINEESFRVAADRLYLEGMGLCTTWVAGDESVERFQQRICDVAGASLTRSPIDGRYHLDLIRDDYVLEDLPILTDDDIISYTEQPGTLDEAVNQVVVEWFDPAAKEDRSTAPLHSLGGIQRAGGVVAQVSTYREIPVEALALRVGERDLLTKGQAQRKFDLVTTRVAWYWRPQQRFRLLAPRRGIADMVCRVGEIDRGTLRSGAISFSALQDVYGMPETSFVLPEPGDGGDASAPPAPPAAARVEEMPYPMLVGIMPPGELAALGADDAYLFAVATPAGSELGYTLHVDAGAGYQEADEAAWTPTALVTAAAGPYDLVVPIASLRNDEEVVAGAMVLWGTEICRLDDIDRLLGTVTLGRGCADTTPTEHPAGSRIWIVTDDVALDATRYVGQVIVDAKMPTRTIGDAMELADAPIITTTTDQRQHRPFPPGRLRINGNIPGGEIVGDFEVTWAHRDRLQQGGELVDHEAASIGPEAGTTYAVRTYLVDELKDEQSGITGTSAEILAIAGSGQVRVEVWASRDGLASWQAAIANFAYRSTDLLPYVDQDAEPYVDQDATPYEG